MQTGLIMFPGAVATGIMMPVGGKLFDKFGAKPVVIPGLLILMLSTYQLSRLTLDTNSHTVMWLMAVRGVGLGLAMMPITTAGMNSVPSHLVARASALQNVIRQVAGSVGITILTTIMTNRQAVNYIRLAEQVSYFDANSVELLGRIQGWLSQQGVPAGEAQGISVSTVFGLVAKEAAVQAINDTLFVTVLIILVTIPLALLMRGKKAANRRTNTW